MKKKVKDTIKKVVIFFYHIMARVLPVSKNVILFESNLGRNYTGNPRAIYERMVELGLDKKYRCVWIMDHMGEKIAGNAIQVKRVRFRYFYYCAIAKVWVLDCRHPRFLRKRKETLYIQTWHGTPLKKLALDMDVVNMGGTTDLSHYKREFRKNTAAWDCLISQNRFSTEIFRRCFDFHKKMLEIGYPRNDLLVNQNEKSFIQNLKKKYKIPQNKKVLLYAPTWRDDQFYDDKRYRFVSALDFQKAKEALGDEYVMLVKYHYLIADRVDWNGMEGFVYSFPAEQEIGELYLIADMLITDYSSVMFDYSLLKRPMLFFAYDIENYQQNLRGFYFNMLEEVPGPVSQTTEELIRDIKEYQEKDWESRYEAFTAKFNHADNGKAALKVIEEIQKHMDLV